MARMPRRLRIQPLERRIALHADVNLDFEITASDALQVINHIAEGGETAAEVGNPLDANLDRKVSVTDALYVVNRIDRKYQPSRIYEIRLGKIDTYGLTEEQVRWSIGQAFADYEEIIDVGFKIVTTGRGDYVLSSKELQLGNRIHARGLASAVGGRYMWFHNGIVSDQPEKCEVCYWEKLWSGNPNTLRKVIRHEAGHAVFSIDMGGDRHGHSNDKSCIMHSDGGASWFCQKEIDWLQTRYGTPKR